MIKLLALDLDGTLLNSSGQIPEANKKAIKLPEEKGVLVTIATGRRFRDARPVALEIGLNAPMICHNGALIKYADSIETVDVSLITAKTVLEILRVGKEFGGDALVSCDSVGKGSLLYEKISDNNIPLQKYVVWSKRLHGNEAEEAVYQVDDLSQSIENQEVIHISFSGTCQYMDKLSKILKAELGTTVNIQATIYKQLDFTLLDILPPYTAKNVGLDKLAKLNGLTSENVMAIGDNFNDLAMLEYAKTPIIMGNASQDLLERKEFYKTLSNDENGVAVAIEKFILGEN